MSQNSIHIPAPLQVNQWHNAFLKLNQARLSSARTLLLPRQQLVLDVLPVLLHLNHPRLPGFIDFKTPAGIRNFSPSTQQIQSLQSLARGMQLPRSGGQTPIIGLYLMGSIGSLAQARSSDLDMWLCHDERLSSDELQALRNKCNLIERWAGEQGIELHIFLMNLSEFRQGQDKSVQGEDCGSTQHLLLLDEFYRSSVWLAGCQPRWWLIPNNQEQVAEEFWQQMIAQHRVDDRNWLNFGAIPFIPPAEFVGAGLWQLSKGLSDPYKSLLKLLLTRHYATQYPNIRPLSWDLKDQVHGGNDDRDANDGYLLLLRRVSQQLELEGNPERIQLARRAFYYKAKLPLSQLTSSQRASWRTAVMIALSKEWQWTEDTWRMLDERPQWTPVRIAKERNALISEMLNSYRFLVGFSQKYVPRLHISRQDMQSLGNRLYAAFDNRPGKIVNINPGISPSLAQEKIALHLRDHVWQLIPGFWAPGTDNHQDQVLKQSPSLAELLCFANLNELLQDGTRVAIYPQHNPLSSYELKQLRQAVNLIPRIQPSDQQFFQPAKPLHWHLLVNVGIDPQHHLSRRGMQKISNRDDALGYSAVRENLVLSIDLVTANSWGEWHVERFAGDACLLQCLQHLLQYLPQAREKGWPHTQVSCYCASRAPAIRQRVEDAVQDVFNHFINNPRSPYVMEVGECYYLLETSKEDTIALRVADTPQKLLALFQRRSKSYVQYSIDRSALLSSPLRLIFEQSKAGYWQMFYWRKDSRVYFYFLDEKGALLHQQWDDDPSGKFQWLPPLLHFIKQVDQRWQLSSGRSSERRLMLYELRRKPLSYEFEIARRKLPENIPPIAVIDVRAVLDNQQQVTLYCNGQEFSAWQHGNDFYPAVIRTVRALRRNNANYPLFLSDLELPDSQNILEHLQIRQRIENRLMQAQHSEPDAG